MVWQLESSVKDVPPKPFLFTAKASDELTDRSLDDAVYALIENVGCADRTPSAMNSPVVADATCRLIAGDLESVVGCCTVKHLPEAFQLPEAYKLCRP